MHLLNFASLQIVEDVSLVLEFDDDDDWIVTMVLGYNARHGYIRMRIIIRTNMFVGKMEYVVLLFASSRFDELTTEY
jgi:hypothetical protein